MKFSVTHASLLFKILRKITAEKTKTVKKQIIVLVRVLVTVNKNNRKRKEFAKVLVHSLQEKCIISVLFNERVLSTRITYINFNK